MKRILFLIPYPAGMAPSQRFRFEQYLDKLSDEGISYRLSPFLSQKAFTNWYKEGLFIWKALCILRGILRRIGDLFSLHQYEYIFIHREVVPIGPPIIEFLIAKVFRKKIIYDFDDAIWIPNASDSNRFFVFLKFYSTVKLLVKWSYKVSCGNNFLCSFAKLINPHVVYNPTTIDTKNYHNRPGKKLSNPVVIGWTGSHSTVRYVEALFPVLERLSLKHPFEFHLISDRSPSSISPVVRFIKWKKDTEIEDLARIDIGLMPLEDDRWAKGKCGFKALQYMALGIPALVSPVGVNTKIVDHGINGFICRNEAEWFNYLDQLLNDHSLIEKLSLKTREKVEQEYSVESNKIKFLNLFTEKHEEYSINSRTSVAGSQDGSIRGI